jgi:hypothetical protein
MAQRCTALSMTAGCISRTESIVVMQLCDAPQVSLYAHRTAELTLTDYRRCCVHIDLITHTHISSQMLLLLKGMVMAHTQCNTCEQYV